MGTYCLFSMSCWDLPNHAKHFQLYLWYHWQTPFQLDYKRWALPSWMRRRMTPPGCYARFPWYAHYACFSLSSVGTKKERRRCCSWSLVTILCSLTWYSRQRSTPICQLGQPKVFVSLLELVWNLSSESAYCKCFIPSLVLISKWSFELCFLNSRVFKPTKRRNTLG
jgi:hypothetical protein